MKVSLILLTIDRYAITKRTVDQLLRNANHPDIELLCIDNGSKDGRVLDYINSLPQTKVHMAYTTNQGMQRSQNILLDRASGDYLCLIGNDILLPPNWLSELVRYNQAIPDSGISGIHCVMHKPEITFYKGMKVRRNDTVFGTMFFNRRFFNKVGYINESFHPYGMDDSELSYRSRKAGYVNYYLPNLTSEHIGHDVGEQSDYRRMKDIALTKSEQIYKSVTEQIDLTGQYYYKP